MADSFHYFTTQLQSVVQLAYNLSQIYEAKEVPNCQMCSSDTRDLCHDPWVLLSVNIMKLNLSRSELGAFEVEQAQYTEQ